MTERTCKHCGQRKPIEDFYTSDMGHCKRCKSDAAIAVYWKNQNLCKEYANLYYETHREECIERMKAYNLRMRQDPEQKKKFDARNALNRAVKQGKVEKPTACPVCGDATRRITGHHYQGYEPEHWLDVVWACSKCHGLMDRGRNNRKAA